jgi:uroporphyrinogen-III decarboxylase
MLLEMDSPERVRSALRFRTPDYVPLFDNYWGDFVSRWRLAHGLAPRSGIPLDDVVEDADLEAYYGIDLAIAAADETPWPSRAEELDSDGQCVLVRTGWGETVRRRRGASFETVLNVALNDKSHLSRMEFDSPQADARYTDFLARVAKLQQRRKPPFVFCKVGGPFLRPSRLRGFTQWLVDIVEDPVFAAELATRVADHLIMVGIESLRRADLYSSGVAIFDDVGSNTNLLVSPRSYHRIFLPQIERMVSAFKQAGASFVMFHSDGDIRLILDGLVEAGIDAINPVEPRAAMDVATLRRRYGNRLAFIGGLCNSVILPSGSQEQVRDHVLHILAAGEDGGLIIGSHSIGADITLERYEFVMQLLHEHARRPAPGQYV